MRYFLSGIIVSVILISSAGCSSIGKLKLNETKSISPGTAEISGQIISFENVSTPTLTILVNSVFAYGSSTPPIITNSKIKTTVPKNLMEKTGNTPQIDKLIKIQKEIYLRIKHNSQQSINTKQNNSWIILDIKY